MADFAVQYFAADQLEAHRAITRARMKRADGSCDPHATTSLRASATAPPALSLYPSAPIASAYCCVTGAPPTMIFTLSRSPATWKASMVVFMEIGRASCRERGE